MEEKIKDTKENDLFENWKARIISILTFIFIFLVFRIYDDVVGIYITNIDIKIGKFYNIFSIFLGILIVIGFTFVFYKLLIRKNTKLTKKESKSVLFKIFILLLLVVYILMNIKAQKYDEYKSNFYPSGGVSLLASLSSENRVSFSGFNPVKIDVEKYGDLDITLTYVIMYNIILFITAIVSVLFIKFKLKNKIYKSDKEGYTSWLSFFIKYTITCVIMSMFLGINTQIFTYPASWYVAYLGVALISIMPPIVSIMSSNFKGDDDIDFKRGFAYLLIAFLIFFVSYILLFAVDYYYAIFLFIILTIGVSLIFRVIDRDRKLKSKYENNNLGE